jgi:hypothetical protein
MIDKEVKFGLGRSRPSLFKTAVSQASWSPEPILMIASSTGQPQRLMEKPTGPGVEGCHASPIQLPGNIVFRSR